jgi:hypothetical protein
MRQSIELDAGFVHDQYRLALTPAANVLVLDIEEPPA